MEFFWQSKDLMEHLIPFLDLPTTLALASTHHLALEVLQQKRIWTGLILSLKLVKSRFWHCGNSVEIKAMQRRVDVVTSLLKLMEEPEPLLNILLNTICLNLPPATDENGHKDVIFINSPKVYNTGFFVSPTGFLLLEQAESGMESKVQVVSVTPYLAMYSFTTINTEKALSTIPLNLHLVPGSSFHPCWPPDSN